MSDTGLYSGVYSQIRVFAKLFDAVLLDLKSGQGRVNSQEIEELGKLLQSAAEPRASNAKTQLLGTLLREASGRREQLADLGKALVEGRIGEAHVQRLENLAQRLERERAGMLGKMRGREC